MSRRTIWNRESNKLHTKVMRLMQESSSPEDQPGPPRQMEYHNSLRNIVTKIHVPVNSTDFCYLKSKPHITVTNFQHMFTLL